MTRRPLTGINDTTEYNTSLEVVLADYGANVIRIDRPDQAPANADVLARGKRSICVSPKTQRGLEIIRKLVRSADVLIDPYRPGTLERLHLGPSDCMATNSRLIYARLVGYTPTSHYQDMAGHDINYLALSGVLSMLRPGGGIPYPPLNLIADFAGGGLICLQGILLALLERSTSGSGQVVSADMVTGTRYVSTFPLLSRRRGAKMQFFSHEPGHNVLDGGAPYYNVYRTLDDKYVSLGAIEPKFYAIFLDTLSKHSGPAGSLAPGSENWTPSPREQNVRSTWPRTKALFEKLFQRKTRDEWERIFTGTDACVAPVLEPQEASQRLGEKYGIPHPAPLLSRTAAPTIGQDTKIEIEAGLHTSDILQELGYDVSVENLRDLSLDGSIRSCGRNRSKL